MEADKSITNILDEKISKEIWNAIHNVLQAKEVDFDYKTLGPRSIRNIANYISRMKNELEEQKSKNSSDFYNTLAERFDLPKVEPNQQAKAIEEFIELLNLEANILQGISNARRAESSVLIDVSGQRKKELANELWEQDVEVKHSNQFKKSVTLQKPGEMKITNNQGEEINKPSGWNAIKNRIRSFWNNCKKFVTNLFKSNHDTYSGRPAEDKGITDSQVISRQTNVEEKGSTYSDLYAQLEVDPSKALAALSRHENELDEVNKGAKEESTQITSPESKALPVNQEHSDNLSTSLEDHKASFRFER